MIRWLSNKLRKPEAVEPSVRQIVLRPDPESRERRLRQFDSKRRERYLKACEGLMR